MKKWRGKLTLQVVLTYEDVQIWAADDDRAMEILSNTAGLLYLPGKLCQEEGAALRLLPPTVQVINVEREISLEETGT